MNDISMTDTISVIKGLNVSQYRRDRALTLFLNLPGYIPNWMKLTIIISRV